MITETTYLEQATSTTKSTMVATDQSTDFTNCENKSETLNVVTNGAYSFRSASNSLQSKLNNNNETENELDFDVDSEDVTDYGRPKKLQKSLTGNNIINQLDNDFNHKSTSKSSSNKLLVNNDQTDVAQLVSSNNNQTSTRRKPNLLDTNDLDDNFICQQSRENSSTIGENNNNSPKVPPLRIVISSSTSGRSSKDVNQNSNNYVVSSTVDSSSTNSNDGVKKENDNFYLTRSSNAQSSTNAAVASSSSTSTGRITTRSRAAASNHLSINDDSQSRYSPEEFTATEFSANEASEPQQQSIYLNSQNIKESNKENKDLRRRKGRGKGPQATLNTAATQSASLTTSSTTTSTSQHSSDSNTPTSIDDPSTISTLDQPMMNLSTTSRDYQMPAYNCYNMFQNIRKQVEKRRQTMCDSANPKSNQKAPQGFKNYLLTTGNYLLESRNESERNVNPNLTVEQINVPELLTKLNNTEQLIELYREQELEREKMKVQHLVEREKVKLSLEQEILRVHNRASLASNNQSLPLSFTVLMKDEEIYNPIDQETEHSFDRNNLESAANHPKETTTTIKNEYSRATYTCISNNTYADLFTLTGKSEDIGSRCRYSGRLLHSWLQDVEDKWGKIKKEIINRQRRESESLHARQLLEWEWKVKELSKKLKIHIEEKSSEKFNEKQWSDDLLYNDQLIPLCKVTEEFDFS